MKRVACLWLALAVVPAAAHEGDSESRAMRLHGLLLQLDRQAAVLAAEPDAARRAALRAAEARLLLEVQETLRDMADKSPCILLEKTDSARQLACLVDTEARLQGSERLLGHLLRRLVVDAP